MTWLEGSTRGMIYPNPDNFYIAPSTAGNGSAADAEKATIERGVIDMRQAQNLGGTQDMNVTALPHMDPNAGDGGPGAGPPQAIIPKTIDEGPRRWNGTKFIGTGPAISSLDI